MMEQKGIVMSKQSMMIEIDIGRKQELSIGCVYLWISGSMFISNWLWGDSIFYVSGLDFADSFIKDMEGIDSNPDHRDRWSDVWGKSKVFSL